MNTGCASKIMDGRDVECIGVGRSEMVHDEEKDLPSLLKESEKVRSPRSPSEESEIYRSTRPDRTGPADSFCRL